MLPQLRLPAINFFLADVGGGLGPYLATWLARAHWSPDRVGYITMAGSIVFMLLSAPAGALLDRVPKPRLCLAIGCLGILLGTMALLKANAFGPVLLSQAVVAAGGALGAPAMAALTLGIVGKNRFPRQQGSNESANHAGNVTAAAAVWGLTFLVGAGAPFVVLAISAAMTLVVLALIPSHCIEPQRMSGRQKKGERPDSIFSLLRHKKLLMLALAIGFFHFGNGPMLPLLGQKLSAEKMGDPTKWMSACVLVSQLVMVPVAYLSGRLADWVGRRALLLAACAVLPVRGVMAAFAGNAGWIVPIEVLDGVGAGLLGVAAPAAIADLTYGSGRTQSAIGFVATLQGVAIAVASASSGFVATVWSWNAAFLALSVSPLVSMAILFLLPLHDREDAKLERSLGES